MTRLNLLDLPPDPGPPSPASRGRPARGSQTEPGRFDVFYRAEYLRVVRYIVATENLNLADAEDVAQEAFLAMMSAFERGLIEHAESYLFVTARRIAARRIYERNQTILTEDIGEWRSTGFEQDTAGELTDREAVLQMIRTLPPTQRTIMTLIYEGLNPAEISEMLKIRPATVRSNLRHARQALREQLDLPRKAAD